jgi:hypothetical protein
MSDKQTGGSAFPLANVQSNSDGGVFSHIIVGMTLRDYFAAKAMQGLLASDIRAEKELFAEHAYKMADAMLKEREK